MKPKIPVEQLAFEIQKEFHEFGREIKLTTVEGEDVSYQNISNVFLIKKWLSFSLKLNNYNYSWKIHN